MILATTNRQGHCTPRIRPLKRALLLSLAGLTASLTHAAQMQPGNPVLRRELMLLVESGRTHQAIERVQAALRSAPQDPAIRHEYVSLHLGLARHWLSQRRFDDCLAAIDAILAVEPEHAPALAIRRQVLEARQSAAHQAPEIERLLRLELFESALQRIQEVRALRSDADGLPTAREHAAWRGAADDHYFARNFNEALALYEHVLSLSTDRANDVRRRWLISLALALSERDSDQPIPPDAARRLTDRLRGVQARIKEPLLGHAVIGLLAERNGRDLDAGAAYAAALDVRWLLPPADQRRSAVSQLRRQVVERLRDLYDADHARVRGAAWRIVLPDVWKQRQTEHFDVYARNDLVAERIAEAAEFHFAGLRAWLDMSAADQWVPRCELRVHATLEDLHRATGTRGVTRALTQTRVQGDRVLLRKINLFQDDPGLLATTLPHELTHLLLADRHRGGKLPLALDEGLALRAEPPARRLQFRRLLRATTPDPAELLTATGIPADELTFYARCAALTGWLLRQAGPAEQDSPGRTPIATVLRAFSNGYAPRWWQGLGWESQDAMRADWAAWHEARRDPPRMPLMFLALPTTPDTNQGE